MPWLKRKQISSRGKNMEFCLVNGEAATFLLEEECYSGVAKIAEKVCGDVELVTGIVSDE